MKDYSDFFIAIYTCDIKTYCDAEFFNAVIPSVGNAELQIVDNSADYNYAIRLKSLSQGKLVHHLDVSRENKETLMLRNITESVNLLRYFFLQSKCKYFVILESDVIPPAEWLDYFLEVIDRADIIGGIYYHGFHRQELFDNPDIFEYVPHALSGCTVYKRELVEKVPFRCDFEQSHAFPDAWICYDAVRHENNFEIANYSKIKCRHLTKQGSDSRGLEDLK